MTKTFYQGNWLLEAWKAVPLPLSMHIYTTFMLQRERLEAGTRSVPRHSLSLSLLSVYVCASVHVIEKDRLEAKHERQFILLKHLCTSYFALKLVQLTHLIIMRIMMSPWACKIKEEI